jgi:hypothetical protein
MPWWHVTYDIADGFNAPGSGSVDVPGRDEAEAKKAAIDASKSEDSGKKIRILSVRKLRE